MGWLAAHAAGLLGAAGHRSLGDRHRALLSAQRLEPVVELVDLAGVIDFGSLVTVRGSLRSGTSPSPLPAMTSLIVTSGATRAIFLRSAIIRRP